MREGVHFKFRLAAKVGIIPDVYIYGYGVANFFRAKSIFRLLYCARAMATSTRRPSVWKCKKKIQLRPNPVYENILN